MDCHVRILGDLEWGSLSEPLVVGLDCGGSTSRLLAMQGDEVVREAVSGPGNWASTPRENLIQHWEELFSGLTRPDSVVVAAAGILTADDRSVASALVRELSEAQVVDAVSDAWAAWRACDDPNAVIVISGTGSLVLSRHANHMVKSGGGGPMIDDVGSGASFARRIIRGYLRQTPRFVELESEILEALQAVRQESPNNAIPAAIYRSPAPAQTLASAGSFLACRENSTLDSELRLEMTELSDVVRAHLERFPSPSPRIFRFGGFWNASERVQRYFEGALGLPTCEPPQTPLWGSVALAKDALL